MQSLRHTVSIFLRELCIGGGSGAIAPALAIFFGDMRRVTSVIRRSAKVIHVPQDREDCKVRMPAFACLGIFGEIFVMDRTGLGLCDCGSRDAE